MAALRAINITATGTSAAFVGSGGGEVWSVNVNTGAASAVLKIYADATAVAANLIATIDCSATGSFWYGIYSSKGWTAVLSGGNADITIGYR